MFIATNLLLRLDVFLKACNNTCVVCVTLQPRFGIDSLLSVILNTRRSCEVQSFVVLSRFSTWKIVNNPSTLLYGNTVTEEMSNSGFSSGCFPSDPQERRLTSDSVLQRARSSVDFE